MAFVRSQRLVSFELLRLEGELFKTIGYFEAWLAMFWKIPKHPTSKNPTKTLKHPKQTSKEPYLKNSHQKAEEETASERKIQETKKDEVTKTKQENKGSERFQAKVISSSCDLSWRVKRLRSKTWEWSFLLLGFQHPLPGLPVFWLIFFTGWTTMSLQNDHYTKPRKIILSTKSHSSHHASRRVPRSTAWASACLNAWP